MFETIVYATENAAVPGGSANMLTTLFPLILLAVVFYFMLIRPQKKKEKQTKEMIAGLGVGDLVTTIGGIMGKVTKVRDEDVLMETGMVGNPGQRSTIKVAKWAVRDINKKAEAKNVLDEPEAAEEQDSEETGN